MKNLVCLFCCLAAASYVLGQEPVLYGKVLKKGMKSNQIKGVSGYEIVLEKDNRRSEPVYPNAQGIYGFYNLPAGFGIYTIKVYRQSFQAVQKMPLLINEETPLKTFTVTISKTATIFDIRLDD